MATYLEIYLTVLDELGVLPEDPDSDTGGSLFVLGNAADEDSITPSDPAYQPLAVFGHVRDAEAEAINAKISTFGDGRKAGEWLVSEGFTTTEIVTKQGAILPSRIGDISSVEVTQESDLQAESIAWEVANPAAMTFVQDYAEFAKRNKLAEYGVFDPLFALDHNGVRIWFTGEACRVTFPAYTPPEMPTTMESLLTVLRTECPAPPEIVSAIKDIAIGATMPREGDMVSAASYFTNRGRASLRGEQVKATPRPAVVTAQKADG